MKKVLLLAISGISLLLFAVNPVYAADVDITCTESGCTPSSVTGFFPSSEIWYPGKSLLKTVKVTNSSGGPISVTVHEQNSTTDADFDQVVQFTIGREGGPVLWDNSLYAFYQSSMVTLNPALAAGTSETYSFTAYMYTTAGNDYQEKSTQFDMVLGFNGGSSSSVCGKQAPAVPGPLSLTRVSDTEVKAVWGAVTGEYTGYRLSWSKDTDTDGDGDGSKSVGKTTETNVTGLELNKYGYYFKIRAVNDCMEGNPTGIVFFGAGTDLRRSGDTLGASTAAPTTGPQRFVQTGAVRGASTSSSSSSKGIELASTTGEVKGEAVACSCIWWPILAVEALVAVFYLGAAGRLTRNSLFSLALSGEAVVAFLVFKSLNKCLSFSYVVFAETSDPWCRYFVLLDAAIVGVVLLAKKILFRKTETS
jgi:hypothetical protein